MNDTLYVIDGVSYTINRADVVAAPSALTTVVAAVSGKKHRVIAWDLQANSNTVSIYWASNATQIWPTTTIQSTSKTIAPRVPFWFETSVGEALKINNATAIRFGYGQVYYITYPA